MNDFGMTRESAGAFVEKTPFEQSHSIVPLVQLGIKFWAWNFTENDVQQLPPELTVMSVYFFC